MIWDIKSQRIAWQLKHFYDRYAKLELPIDPMSQYRSHFLLDQVYDWLKDEGHNMEYPADIKNELYRMAKLDTATYHKSWVKALKDPRLKQTAKEELEVELKKYYKTYLVRKFLIEKLNEGQVVNLTDENGKKINAISFG